MTMRPLIAGFLLLLAAIASAQNPAPKIVCDQPEFNFGIIEKTGVVTHAFAIRNGGDATLEITDVRASCGCTTTTVSQTTLAPGQTGTVTVVFAPAGRTGPQEKRIAVFSTDSARAMMVLIIRGDVKRDILLTPERLSAGRIRPDKSIDLKIDVENNTARPMHITSASTDNENLAVSVSEIEAGRRYAVNVKTVPPLRGGNMESIIHIFTDSTNLPVVDVPFQANILGPLTIVPAQLNLSESDGPVSRFIVVAPGTVSTVGVVNVELPDPAMKWQQMKFGAGGVRIVINDIVPRMALDGKTIKITTDCNEHKEVIVPIRVAKAIRP